MAPDPDQELQASIQHANEPITRTDAISILWRVLGEWNANDTVPGVEEAREAIWPPASSST